MYYLCEKYYKYYCTVIVVQYYTADCVSWVPRLTLLDLTNKLDLGTHTRNGTHLYVGDLLYIFCKQGSNKQQVKCTPEKRFRCTFERKETVAFLQKNKVGMPLRE